MRISLFLNNDLESNVALNCLLPELAVHDFTIYLSEKVGVDSAITPLQHLAYLEREFINTSLFPELEKKQTSGFQSFNQISNRFSAPIRILNDVTSLETIQSVRAFQPDLFISIRFGKIFKGEILSIPPLGIINLHSAILPDYKGVMGTFRAFINNEKEIGSTIHFITDKNIDEGNIIRINRTTVQHDKSILWHIIHLYPQATAVLKTIISQLEKSMQVESVPQQKGGHYYTFPTTDDFEILKYRGIQLFNKEEYAEILSHFYQVDPQWALNEINQNGKLAN